MQKQLFIFITALTFTVAAAAQQKANDKKQQFVDLSFGFGSNSQGNIAAGYFHNWNLGKNSKFFIGTGACFNI